MTYSPSISYAKNSESQKPQHRFEAPWNSVLQTLLYKYLFHFELLSCFSVHVWVIGANIWFSASSGFKTLACLAHDWWMGWMGLGYVAERSNSLNSQSSSKFTVHDPPREPFSSPSLSVDRTHVTGLVVSSSKSSSSYPIFCFQSNFVTFRVGLEQWIVCSRPSERSSVLGS